MKKKALIYTEDTTSILQLASYLISEAWEITTSGPSTKILEDASLPFTLDDSLQSRTQWNDSFLSVLRSIMSTRIDSENLVNSNEDNILLVAINLNRYRDRGASFLNERDTIEDTIDLKYTTLIRAAVKNYMNVIVLTDPDDYGEAITALKVNGITREYRLYLAGKALNMTSTYDASFSNYILFKRHSPEFPKYLVIPYKKQKRLLQGSNPHQAACLYTQEINSSALYGCKKIQGREVTYNMIRNYSIAWNLVSLFLDILKNPFEVPSTDSEGHTFSSLFTPAVSFVFVVGVKNANLIGGALGQNIQSAFFKAYNYSPENFSRSCIGCSSVIDREAAILFKDKDFYAIIAPDFTREAREILSENKNLRLLISSNTVHGSYEVLSIDGGLLVQNYDKTFFKRWSIVTKKRPTQKQTDSLAFGVMINMKARSDSVTIVNDDTVVGFSLCQPSRKKALMLAIEDAKRTFSSEKTTKDTSNEVLISDSSLVRIDNIEEIATLGVRSILQEGGGADDQFFIDFCNAHDIAMVFTGMRHLAF